MPHTNQPTNRSRDPTRYKRRLILASLAGVAGLAGCAGGDGEESDENETGESGGDDDSESPESSDADSESTESSDGDTETGETTTTIESMCSIEQNSVDQLSIVGCESTTEEESLVATVTVRNEGDQETNLFNYRWRGGVYVGTETTLENKETGSRTVLFPDGRDIAAGDTKTVEYTLQPNPGVSIEDIEQYTIELGCGFGGDAAYCE